MRRPMTRTSLLLKLWSEISAQFITKTVHSSANPQRCSENCILAKCSSLAGTILSATRIYSGQGWGCANSAKLTLDLPQGKVIVVRGASSKGWSRGGLGSW